MPDPSEPPQFRFFINDSTRAPMVPLGLGMLGLVFIWLPFKTGHWTVFSSNLAAIGAILVCGAAYIGLMLVRSREKNDLCACRAYAGLYLTGGFIWALSMAATPFFNGSLVTKLAVFAFCGSSAVLFLWGFFVWSRWLAVVARREGKGLIF